MAASCNVALKLTSEPKPKEHSSSMDLEKQIVELGERITHSLSRLGTEPRPFEGFRKYQLLDLIEDLDNLAASVEARAEDFSLKSSQECLESLEHVLEIWRGVNDAIEHTVALAVLGRIDKRFLFLSPIANRANTSGLVRLERLRRRLVERTTRGDANRESVHPRQAVSDPDLIAFGYAPIVSIEEKSEPTTVPTTDFEIASPPSVERPATFCLGPAAMKEEEAFEKCLAKLFGADEIDRDEAMLEVISRYQHLLIARLLQHVGRRDATTERILQTLWRHGEIVLLEDYFFANRRMKLTHILASAEPYPVGAFFQQLLTLFHLSGSEHPNPSEELTAFRSGSDEDRETILRSMLIHPLRSFRRYGITALAPSRYWSVVSYPKAPMAGLADILDRLADPDVSDDYRKVFFDCTLKRLAQVRTEPQVRSARKMIERFFAFDFFLEDGYFRKLLKLNELVERHEKRLEMDNSFFRRSLDEFKKAKDREGPLKTRLPGGFTAIPLPVQRKLAREGHYFKLFIRHPHPKIALETIRFINAPTIAEAVLKVKTTNRRVILEIAKKEELLSSYAARLALLGNPHTPLEVGLKHLPMMRTEDLRRLSASRDINPQIRDYLNKRSARKKTPLGGR